MFNQLYITNKTKHFSFKWARRAGFEAYKRRLAYSVMVGIWPLYKAISLEYKGNLNKTIKFLCVPMCSLVMSLHSRDLLITHAIHCRINHTALGF